MSVIACRAPLSAHNNAAPFWVPRAQKNTRTVLTLRFFARTPHVGFCRPPHLPLSTPRSHYSHYLARTKARAPALACDDCGRLVDVTQFATGCGNIVTGSAAGFSNRAVFWLPRSSHIHHIHRATNIRTRTFTTHYLPPPLNVRTATILAHLHPTATARGAGGGTRSSAFRCLTGYHLLRHFASDMVIGR